MAASGKAADSGNVADAFASVNTSLGVKVAVDKAQTFTAGQKTQARSNMGAQAQAAALDQVTALAVTGNSGKVLSIDASGNVVATTPATSGGAAVDSTTYTGTITN